MMRAPQPYTLRGWLQLGIAWHLMEHGQATLSQLCSWLDAELRYLCEAIKKMTEEGFLQLTPNSAGTQTRCFALTRKGLDAAVVIDKSGWAGTTPNFNLSNSTLINQETL